MRMSLPQFGWGAYVGAGITVLCSCTDVTPVAITPAEIPAIADNIAPGVAEYLDRDGRFLAEALHSTIAPDEITSGRARELAVAFIRTYAAVGLAPIVARDHGAPVDPKALTPCGRIYYAESPYAPLDDQIGSEYHRLFGDWWLVTFCGPGAVRQVSVAVSTRTTLYIDDAGNVRHRPFQASYNIEFKGIPRTLGALPPEPESAVAVVSNLTGRRIVGVPRLLAHEVGYYPQWARWSVGFDSPVTMIVRSAEGRLRTSVFSQGLYGVYSRTEMASVTPAEAQPTGTPFTWTPLVNGKWLDDQRQSSLARREPTKPLRFDRITPGGHSRLLTGLRSG